MLKQVFSEHNQTQTRKMSRGLYTCLIRITYHRDIFATIWSNPVANIKSHIYRSSASISINANPRLWSETHKSDKWATYSVDRMGSVLTSCIVRSENRTTMLSSTLTIRPVSPSYRPAMTLTWSPILKYLWVEMKWIDKHIYQANVTKS